MLITLAKLSSIQIFAIDYSLSPESNFPKAIDETISSYNALLERGFKNENIYFGGDSAGGNLTLVSTLKLQELNQQLPSKLFLLSPWTDLTGEGRSIKENSKSDPYLSYDYWLKHLSLCRKLSKNGTPQIKIIKILLYPQYLQNTLTIQKP